MAKRLEEAWKAWCEGGGYLLRDGSSLNFVLSSIHRTRAGGIMLVCANQETDNPNDNTPTDDVTDMLAVAVEAIKT